MALSKVTAIGNGVTNEFAVSFALGYISQDQITCQVGNETDGLGNPLYRTITFLSTELVRISGAPPGNGVKVKFLRTVPKTSLIIDFDNGDTLEEANLDTSQKHSAMAAHEALDGRINFSDDLSLNGFGLINTRDPVNDQDVVTKKWAIAQNATSLASSIAAAAAANGYAIAAKASEVSAGTSSTASNAAAAVAQAARDQTLLLVGSAPLGVSTIAALRSLLPVLVVANTVAAVSGYYAKSDDGGGIFSYDATSTKADDNGAYIKPNFVTGAGRWIRQFPGGYKSVRHWGATCNNTGIGDQAAFNAAVAYMNTGTDNSGGIIHIPAGTSRFTSSFAPTTLEPYRVAGYTFQGDGQHNTILDFSGCPANSDGVVLTGIGVKFRDIKVVGAPRDCLSIINFQHGEVSRVRVQNAGRDGLRITDSYMVTLTDIWGTTNGVNGFTIGIRGGGGPASGYNTSIDGHSLYGYMNGDRGIAIDNTSYSSFTACGSDLNNYGWVITNVSGVVLVGCGSESNKQDGFYTAVSTSLATGATTPDITGLVLTGCFGYNNGIGNTTANNFVYAGAFDGRQLKLAIVGGADLQLATGVTRSVTVTGATADVSDITSSYLGSVNYLSGAMPTGVVKLGSWPSYNATVAATGGSIVATGLVAKAISLGKTTHMRVFFTVSQLTSPSGVITVTLPKQAAADGVQTGLLRDTNTGGALQGFIGSGGTVLNIQKLDGGYPAAVGSNIAGSMTYETV